MTNDKNDSLREALRRVFAAQRRYYHQNAQRIGLATGQGQGTILAQLRREDHLTQRELADRCNIDTTTMSRALDRLEENGLLCRRNAGVPPVLSDRADGRRAGKGRGGAELSGPAGRRAQ